MMRASSAHVAVLMATYNGQRFLPEQLESIYAQTHGDYAIYASDDGSQDGTAKLLEEARARLGADRFHILSGPRQGFVANFLSMICNPDIEANYFAFSDQDDIWLDTKLERAMTLLAAVPANTPALYGGRTILVDDEGKRIGQSSLFRRPPDFANALVQSIAGGNTMVMNAAARDLLRAAGPLRPVSHDWWSYMLVSGADGVVHYDPEPQILYRQHGSNVIGNNVTLASQLKRVAMLLDGRFKNWNRTNIACLLAAKHLLTPRAAALLNDMIALHSSDLPVRVRKLASMPLRRQTLLGSLGLGAAVLGNRF